MNNKTRHYFIKNYKSFKFEFLDILDELRKAPVSKNKDTSSIPDGDDNKDTSSKPDNDNKDTSSKPDNDSNDIKSKLISYEEITKFFEDDNRGAEFQRKYTNEMMELDRLKISTLKDMVETREITQDGVTNTYKIM